MLKWSNVKHEGDVMYFDGHDEDFLARVETCIPSEETSFCNRRWWLKLGDWQVASGFCLGSNVAFRCVQAIYRCVNGEEEIAQVGVDIAKEGDRTAFLLFGNRKEGEVPKYLDNIHIDAFSDGEKA
jgi:hypothetical protein